MFGRDPGIGPGHAWLNQVGRVKYISATGGEAVAALELCAKLEGIIAALEPAHALAKMIEIAPRRPKDHSMVINLSRRQGSHHYRQSSRRRPRRSA